MKSIITKKHLFFTILLIGLIGLGYWILSNSVFSLNSKEFNDWIGQLGWKAPITMIALMMIEIIIPLLPGGWLALASGYIFGPWFGFIYAYLASIAGSMVLFYLSRTLGQPFVQLMTSPERSNQFANKIHHVRPALGLLYAIPLFPVELLTLLLGLTTMSTRRFMIVMMLGYIPNMVALNFLGTMVSGPDNNYQTIFLILVGLAICYVLASWLRQRIFAKSA